MSTDAYPHRESHFAHKYCRLLAKRVVANDIGPEACWLLTIVVMTEDARRYAGPVTFFNHQLMPLCGFDSENRLHRVRTKAVAAGWLHYESSAKRKPGRYWVTVPPEMDAADSPLDEESPSKMPGQNDGESDSPPKCRSTGARVSQVECKQCGGPPILFPVPLPSPIKSPLPPKGGRALRRTWKRPETRTLQDTDALLRWFVDKLPRLGLKDDHETRRRVLAAAERALEVGDDPSKLFAALIRDALKGDWSKLSDDQLERGKQRLREATSQRRASTGGTTSIGSAVAAVLKDRGVTP